MDRKAGLFSDLKGNKGNVTLFCFQPTMSTSSGIWLKDHPLDYSFPLLLAQMSIIFVASRLTHAALRPLGIPQVISHTIAGIILGPSCLCQSRRFQETIFPLRSWVHLDLVSQLAFILFIFVVGVKTDLSLIRRSGRKALCVAAIGTVLPYVVIIAAAVFHPGIIGDAGFGSLVTNLASCWAITSNTVVSCLLAEFNLLTSKLGRLAMSASLIAEFQAVILSVLFNSFYYGATIMNTLSFLLYFCAFITFVWLLARPLAIWIIRRTPGGSEIDETYFLVVVLLALGSSIIGDIIGETPMAGPLLLGLLLPGGPPLGTALVDRLDGLVSSVFLPVFFAVAGLRTNFHEFSNNKLARQSNGYSNWSRAGYLIIVGTLGKFTGVIIPCIFCKIPLRDAFILALILNCHGVVEIFSFNNWEDYEEADGEVYSVSILALVVVGGTCGALLKALYGPSARFSARRRRTVQGLGHIGELRMLTCVHGEESVPPLLAFIDVIYPSAVSPICIYLLHLYP
ncbi:hypothetical protein HPP92_013847 [Vanilla planifolia]|uniref:Cation/H+ exchanger transmembrane domain-containing protein n=1 Tax=Vanilla planifolia TaxID=51239 RepID=A0A835QP66_VANPL|nr:hypothetical protein HPP92_013847 [Vanilla planifolia]